MAIPKSFLDELRARASLARYAQRHLTWDRKKTRADKGEYWACCPFHDEKTPSFKISDELNGYYCFGCGEKGGLFDFVERMEQVAFPEAVRILAEENGMTVPAMTEREQKREEEGTRLAEANRIAAAYYREKLEEPGGREARDYLRSERGLSAKIIERFGLGYAPPRSGGLIKRLKVHGVDEEDAVAAGLLRRGERGDLYEFFRNRVMFPVEAPGRGVVAFGGRALDDGPKYINSPESPIFQKGGVLYHMGPAREAARKERRMVVAEGYMDVIAMAAAGFDHVVAPMGTALTEAQLQILWLAASEVVVALDGDEAGMRAADRAMDLALPTLRAGREMRFALFPQGMDPDDLLRERGVGGLRAVLEDALATVDMAWRRLLRDGSPDTPERAAELDRRIDELVNRLPDDSLRRHYRRELRGRLWNLGTARRPRRAARGGAQPLTMEARSSPLQGDSDVEGIALRNREFAMLQGLHSHPELLEFADEIGRLEFSAKDLETLRDDIISAVVNGDTGSEMWQETGRRLEQIGRSLPYVRQVVPFLQGTAGGDSVRTGLHNILKEYQANVNRLREMRYVCDEMKAGSAGPVLDDSLREATGALYALKRRPGAENIDEQHRVAVTKLHEMARSRHANPVAHNEAGGEDA